MKTIGPTKFFMSDKTDPKKAREDYIKDFESCLFKENFIISYKDLWILEDSGFVEVQDKFSIGCNMNENFATLSYLMDYDPIVISSMFLPTTYIKEINGIIIELYFNNYGYCSRIEDNFFMLSLIGSYDKQSRLPKSFNSHKQSIIRYGDHGKVISTLTMKKDDSFWYFNSKDYVGYLNDNYLLEFDWYDINMENKRKVDSFTFICDQDIVNEKIIKSIFGERSYKSSEIRNWRAWITAEDIDLIRMMRV